MRETYKEACAWITKTVATKQQLQSLAGKLNFISNCVRPARRFMNRILEALRQAHDQDAITVTEELRRDVAWFRDFANQSNGKLLIEPKLPCLVLECDACPRGGGGFSDTDYYSLIFPQTFQNQYHISQLEAMNSIVAIKTLTPPDLTAARILVKTDYSATHCPQVKQKTLLWQHVLENSAFFRRSAS